MAGSFSDAIENAVLNHLFRNTSLSSPATVYVGLFTTAPTDAAAGTEVAGNSYARQAVTFGAPSGGVITNSADVTFPTATGNWGTIEGYGIYDSDTAGTMYAWSDDPSITVNSGNQAKFAAGQLSISLS